MPHKQTSEIVEPAARKHLRRRRKFIEFTHSSTRATIIMLIAALGAFAIENIPILPSFVDFWNTFYLSFSFGEFTPKLSIGHFINDFLMAIFFLIVGLEIKYELTAGELKSPRKALLPILGAAGGAVVPALVFVLFSMGSGFEKGWGVPMANDIAFCLGVLALLGSRVPLGLRVLLSTMTIADDIIAILVIAVFYTEQLNVIWLIAGLAVFGVLILINRMHVYELPAYIIIGLVMWVFFLLSGVHATIAGVLLALTIPAKTQMQLPRVNTWFVSKAKKADDRYDPGEPAVAQKEYLSELSQISKVSRMSIPAITRLDHMLHTPVYFFILPIFAFSNAGVSLIGTDLLGIVTHPVALGVFFGLLVGKPAGIFFATWLTVKLKLSDLPEGVTWGHMIGVSILGGVGFTMAIFVTNLAFTDPAIIAIAKTAILVASLIAGIVGFFVLRKQVSEEDDDEDEASDQDVKAVSII